MVIKYFWKYLKISIFAICSVWQESYDKIKNITPGIKFLRGLDTLNIIEPNFWLIIDEVAEFIEELSQDILQLFTIWSYPE